MTSGRLFNHDPNMILGRTPATAPCDWSRTAKGLRVECDLPNTTVGRDVAESIKRGDIQGQSSQLHDPARTSGTGKSDPVMRTVHEVDEVYDVGPVTYPAYLETSVAMRAFQAHQAKPTCRRQRPQRPRHAPPTPAHQIEHEHRTARLRLLEVS